MHHSSYEKTQQSGKAKEPSTSLSSQTPQTTNIIYMKRDTPHHSIVQVEPFIISKNVFRFLIELPVSLTAFFAISLRELTFSLILLPSSLCSSLSKPSIRSSLLRTPPSTAIAIPRFEENWAEILWSPKRGRHIIGTPSMMLSSVEFHLQWVKNAPVAGCPITLYCGAHGTTIPLQRVRSRNPAGRLSLSLSLRDHRKRTPLASSPSASAASSDGGGMKRVPKLT